MKREEFITFVDKTLDEVILYTKLATKRNDLNKIEFQWLKKDAPILTDREEIISEIVSKVFVVDNKIYPIADLQIREVKDSTVVIKGWIANYEPRKFGKNWANRPGPFIYAMNTELFHPSIDPKSKEFFQLMKDNGIYHDN